jgi:DNA-binding CsgD family transcriptional regulator
MLNEPAMAGPRTSGHEPGASVLEARAGPSPSADQQLASAHVLQLLDQVADLVRDGAYAGTHHDGVLIDIVVGGTRCVLLVQEPSLLVRLSPREQEVARMVAAGRTNQAIACALDISVWTVSTHLRRIFAKLAVSTRTEMVSRIMAQRGLPASALGPPACGRG